MDRFRVTCLDCASAQAGECVRAGFGCTLQERIASRGVPETVGGFRLPEESHSLQLALGAVIGMALPETEKENEWMGETRDQMLDRAQDMARDVTRAVTGGEDPRA